MSVSKAQTERFGANPFVVEGPIVLGSGVPAANFTLGSVCWGDSEAEWVYCSLALGSTTTLAPGTWMQWDKDYNASLLTTANAVVGQRVGVFSGANQAPTISGGPAGSVTLAAGTYFIWVQRSGQAASIVTAAVTPNLVIAETTATAGAINAPASPTVTTKQITPVSFSAANKTFTATTTNGSTLLTVLSGASVGSGPFIGATVTGTGIPASTTVTGLTYSPSGTIQSITISNAATANGTAITITATGVLEIGLMWAYLAKVN